MTFSWPPQNAAKMRALQQKYGRDADIAAALGVSKHTVERCRQTYGLPTAAKRSPMPTKTGKNISEDEIAEMFAGRRYVSRRE